MPDELPPECRRLVRSQALASAAQSRSDLRSHRLHRSFGQRVICRHISVQDRLHPRMIQFAFHFAIHHGDAMRMLGRRCPDDISVVGHNDMPLVDLVSPPLTTVRIEHREMDAHR